MVDIQDFNEIYQDGNAFVFYWIQFCDITSLEIVWEWIKFYSWLYLFRLVGVRQFRINPKMGPGHGVLAGRDEDIFKTYRESIIEYYVQQTLDNVDSLEDIIDKEE